MITVFIVLQVLIAISLVVIILLQHGKGADIGSAFGGGNNNAMFAPADATKPYSLGVPSGCRGRLIDTICPASPKIPISLSSVQSGGKP